VELEGADEVEGMNTMKNGEIYGQRKEKGKKMTIWRGGEPEGRRQRERTKPNEHDEEEWRNLRTEEGEGKKRQTIGGGGVSRSQPNTM
jgi:hypothetical protein